MTVRQKKADAGFTLIELLVVIVLMGVVGSLVTSLAIRTLHVSGGTQARLVAQSSAQTALERLSRDARVANPLSPKTTSSELWLHVQRGAKCEERRWYVSSGDLLQQTQSLGTLLCSQAPTATASGPLTTSTVLKGLTDDAVATLFTYWRQVGAAKTMTAIVPDATTAPFVDRVVINLSVKAYQGRAPLLLTSAVDLRNVVLS